jgi:hypothetical protein
LRRVGGVSEPRRRKGDTIGFQERSHMRYLAAEVKIPDRLANNDEVSSI